MVDTTKINNKRTYMFATPQDKLG